MAFPSICQTKIKKYNKNISPRVLLRFEKLPEDAKKAIDKRDRKI